MSVVAAKAYLRSVLGTSRKHLSAAYGVSVSGLVQKRLIESSAYQYARSIVLYAPKDHEIETKAIFADAVATGRVVLFPRISRDQLSLVRVDDPAELQPGAFGVLEPTGAEIVPVADVRQGLICVPGLAFSPSGQRLGRGGGYYDRLLAQAGSQSRSAGLAYSFQVLDQIPQSPGDRRLDLIFTESALYQAENAFEPAGARADQGGV
jgi:5-formyltetrahydrofolate cyclo-ligase